jgi:hypothetical protein
MNTLTQEELRRVLDFDHVTGIFTWIGGTKARMRAGTEAGNRSSVGYVSIMINGKQYRAHRLAWLWEYGEFPKHETDHINGIRNDNRIANLREATHCENMQNQRKMHKNNKTGYLGVYPSGYRKNPWRVTISVQNKTKHVGHFATKEEAREAYLEAKRQYHAFCTI